MKTRIISIPENRTLPKEDFPSIWRTKKEKTAVIVLRTSKSNHVCLHSDSPFWTVGETENASSSPITWGAFERVMEPITIEFNP